MHIFYCPEFAKGATSLSEDESYHCVKVLRLRAGTKVNVIDGEGGFYYCEISGVHPKHCQLIVEKSVKNYNRRNYYLHIALAPTKQSERFENFIDKAIEIGVDRITPMLTQRSERKKLRYDRINRVAVSAAKQSRNAYLPKIDNIADFEEILKVNDADLKVIATCKGNDRKILEKLVKPGSKNLILIGPEGDFTDEEIKSAKNNEFTLISLGYNRLRTETAGMVACQIIKSVNQLQQ